MNDYEKLRKEKYRLMEGIEETLRKASSKLRQKLKHGIRKRTYYGSTEDGKNQKHRIKLERNRQLQKLRELDTTATMMDLPPDTMIYSRKTSEQYIAIIDKVSKIAELKRPNRWRTISDAREFFTEYLEDRICQYRAGEISAWTVRQEAAALAKALCIRTTDFGLTFPQRKREEIRKNRTIVPQNGFSEKLNEDCVLLAKAVGTRTNCELLRLKPSDFGLIPDNDCDKYGRTLVASKMWSGSFGVKVTGKGGKTRWILVRPDLVDQVKNLLIKYDPDKRIFTKSHNPVKARFPGHIYRREYVRIMYGILMPTAEAKFSELVRKNGNIDKTKIFYYCRGSRSGQIYYKEALQQCSWLLGHSRLDVVVNNYLDDPISVSEAITNSEKIREILNNV